MEIQSYKDILLKPTPLKRMASINDQDQKGLSTCWAYVTARIITRLIKTILQEDFTLSEQNTCDFDMSGFHNPTQDPEHLYNYLLSSCPATMSKEDKDKNIDGFAIFQVILNISINLFGDYPYYLDTSISTILRKLLSNGLRFIRNFKKRGFFYTRAFDYFLKFGSIVIKNKYKFCLNINYVTQDIFKNYSTSSFLPSWITQTIDKGLYLGLRYTNSYEFNCNGAHFVTITNYERGNATKNSSLIFKNSWGKYSTTNMISDDSFFTSCPEVIREYYYIDYSSDLRTLFNKVPENKAKIFFVTEKEGLYVGDLSDDLKKNGYGIMNYEFFHPGEVYYGLWKDDKRHGSGVQVDSYKTLLEGSWVNDKKEGVFFKRNYLEEIRMTYFKNDVEDEKSKNIYLNKKVILLENFKKKSNLFDILKGGKKSRKSKKIRKNKKSRKSKKYIIKK